QILTGGQGGPNNTTKTLIMYLNEQIGTSKNYGMAGALSVIIFIVCAALSLVVYYFLLLTEATRSTKKGR
ncbi:carbohydrate ABC transporter substrate-binding protein, partial [human gut metagenome]